MAVAVETVSLVSELERRLVAVEPAAFLVCERVLRKVIKYQRHPVSFGLRVPHHTNSIVDGRALLDIVSAGELSLNGRVLPATAILILRPEAEEVADLGLPGALLRCWRLLFHARVHLALEQQIAAGKLTPADIDKRIACLGRIEFEEAQQVLGQEQLLLPPHGAPGTFVEFAAVYLELRHFAPALVEQYFPALGNEKRIDALLAEDVDAQGLLAETRLQGAPEPPPRAPAGRRVEAADNSAVRGEPRPTGGPAIDPDTLVLQANQVSGLGNLVRAAILRTHAAGKSTGIRAEQLAREARHDLYRLVQRLQTALGFPDLEAIQWRQLLPILLPRAARGLWTAEARFLYDLQSVCIDHEREIYSVDVVKWLLALGRLPLKRPLPGHREVLMVKHLRGAARLLAGVRLTDADRVCISQLLAALVRRGEKRLRDHFRPLLETALNDVQLLPANLPEQVARHKLIEELLDNIGAHGFLNMSDLRDALSRNQLKLPDLSGLGVFIRGDRLIRLNRQLSASLDGVYHAGEIYRRWLQRLSSLAFGNRYGRFLTRYIALPFGGAFVLVEGFTHLWHIIHKIFAGAPVLPAQPEHKGFASPWAIVLVGLFILGVLYVPAFRRTINRGLELAGRALRTVFVDIPRWIIRLPITRPLWLVLKTILKPLLPAAVAAEIGALAGMDLTSIAWLAGGVFVGSLLVLYSRWGRDFQESCADWFMRGWHRISANLIPGLLRWIIDGFKRILDFIDRVVYIGDEWLRFRSGERSFMLPVKAALGVVWFLITYVIRFAVNLLIEPQINPIKHFPVVTVGHKLILPLAIPPGHRQPSSLAEALLAVFPLTVGRANAIAGTVVWGIPGIFGFLVWELKENWRLYRANRAPELQPVMVGSHGETVIRLLRPGFHSGTIPKLFARLRRAQRRGRRRAARRQLDALHHVEESIARFTDRELIELLKRSRCWENRPLEVAHIALATNRIRIAITDPDRPEEAFVILLEQNAGHILARTIVPAWIGGLSIAQKTVLADALAGFFKLAGAETVEPGSLAAESPLVGDGRPIAWQEWVETWDKDQSRCD